MTDITRRSLLLAGLAPALSTAIDLEGSLPNPRPTRNHRMTTASPVLFVAAHPDDETLAMGVAIAEHVASGQDVHVLWLTRGEASGVRDVLNGTAPSSYWGVTHDPAAEGYTALSPSQFGAARIAEATNALRCFGAVTIHEAGLADGAVTQTDAETAIAAVADQIAPGTPVRLKGHSHTVDDHADHLAIGNAILTLGDTDPARFGDRRHYVLPTYWTDPRLGQVSWSWDNPGSVEIAARAANACRAYGAWSPPHAFAIGHHSVPQLWQPLLDDPWSMVHT